MAEEHGDAETMNFEETDGVYDRLMEMTGGRGPDRCIDAVGAEAHGTGSFDAVLDKVPFGAAMNKGLTMKMGQTHVARYHRELFKRIEAGEIDPSFVITHRLKLEDAPEAYKTFRDKEDGCIKVVLTP